MQKEWYIIYTKHKCEKKVAACLKRKKIQNFYPLNCRHIKEYRVNKIVYEPLFTSYVFAKIERSQTDILKQFNRVINLVYWKNELATIPEKEIDAIKEFTGNHSNIILIKIPVEVNAQAAMIDRPSYSMDGKLLTVKNRSKKMSLPALGIIMVAEIVAEVVIGREVANDNQKLVMQ
jgi:transcription termination/antitermination protein NusG